VSSYSHPICACCRALLHLPAHERRRILTAGRQPNARPADSTRLRQRPDLSKTRTRRPLDAIGCSHSTAQSYCMRLAVHHNQMGRETQSAHTICTTVYLAGGLRGTRQRCVRRLPKRRGRLAAAARRRSSRPDTAAVGRYLPHPWPNHLRLLAAGRSEGCRADRRDGRTRSIRHAPYDHASSEGMLHGSGSIGRFLGSSGYSRGTPTRREDAQNCMFVYKDPTPTSRGERIF
jgi:hypothetical protein